MQKKNSEKYGSRKAAENHALLPLPAQELYAVLRAADDVIGEGGRTQVAKILKGSKEKQLLEKGLDQNPAYGFFHDLKQEQIMEKRQKRLRHHEKWGWERFFLLPAHRY